MNVAPEPPAHDVESFKAVLEAILPAVRSHGGARLEPRRAGGPAMTSTMVQVAPWPTELEDLVRAFRYKPGWSFRLVSDLERDFEREDTERENCIGRGTTLVITSLTYNSYRDYTRDQPPDYRVNHYKIVPAATFNRRSWRRWLLDMCIEVEIHEACEFARFVDDNDHTERPWAPHHGPGENPYVISEMGTETDVRTSFRGEMNP